MFGIDRCLFFHKIQVPAVGFGDGVGGIKPDYVANQPNHCRRRQHTKGWFEVFEKHGHQDNHAANHVWHGGGGGGTQVGAKLLGSDGHKHGPVANAKTQCQGQCV